MKDSTYELAKSIFAQAYKTDNWNAEAFAVWRLSASTPSWNRLEVAWQEEGCPKAFSWPILKEAVEASARSFCSPPLEMLGAFLYSPDTQSGYEGYWLDWQTDEVKADIYRTAQTWMEQAALGLNEQAWILLRIAISSKCMPQWRGAPEKCVSEMDWYTGMRFLNTCSLETLTVPDIERIPFNNVSAENTRPFHNTLIGTMLKSCDSHWRTVARCIEDKAGPGLWLTYVLSGDKNVMEAKRKVAWNNMKLDGVDAKESVRARALVSAHLAQINNPNVYVVKSMPEMLMTSIRLYPAVAAMRQAQTMMDNVRSEYTTGMGTSGPTHP